MDSRVGTSTSKLQPASQPTTLTFQKPPLIPTTPHGDKKKVSRSRVNQVRGSGILEKQMEKTHGEESD